MLLLLLLLLLTKTLSETHLHLFVNSIMKDEVVCDGDSMGFHGMFESVMEVSDVGVVEIRHDRLWRGRHCLVQRFLPRTRENTITRVALRVSYATDSHLQPTEKGGRRYNISAV